MKFWILLLVISLPTLSYAQKGEGGRGSKPEAMTPDGIKNYIRDGGLRDSVKSLIGKLIGSESAPYPLNKISAVNHPKVKAKFQQMLEDDALLEDINTEGTYVLGLENCKRPGDKLNPDSTNSEIRAWTTTGTEQGPAIGANICFDAVSIYYDALLKNLSLTDVAIELTMTVFHEYTHHFQTGGNDLLKIKADEQEANDVGAFVLGNIMPTTTLYEEGAVVNGVPRLLEMLLEKYEEKTFYSRGAGTFWGGCNAKTMANPQEGLLSVTFRSTCDGDLRRRRGEVTVLFRCTRTRWGGIGCLETGGDPENRMAAYPRNGTVIDFEITKNGKGKYWSFELDQ